MNRIFGEMPGHRLGLVLAVLGLWVGGCGKPETQRADMPTSDTPQAVARLTGVYRDRDSNPPLHIHFMGGHACKVGSDRSHPVYDGTYTVRDNVLLVDLGVVKQPVTIVDATTLQTTWEGTVWTLKKE